MNSVSSVARLLRRPLRPLLLLLQVLVGTVVIAVSVLIATAQNQALGDGGADLFQVVAGSRTANSVSMYPLFQLSDLPKIQKAAPAATLIDLSSDEWVQSVTAGGSRFKVAQVLGTGANYPRLAGIKILHGQYFSAQDIERDRKVVALSRQTSQIVLGRENGVGQSVKIKAGPEPGAVSYEVVAIFEDGTQSTGNMNSMLLPIQQRPGPFGGASHLLVRAAPGQATQAKEQVLASVRQVYAGNTMFKQNKGGVFTAPGNNMFMPPPGENPTQRVYFVVAALALSITALGILSTMLVGVRERTRDIGLRRALGATRASVVGDVLTEATLMTVLGSALGLALVALALPGLSQGVSGQALRLNLPLAAGIFAALLGCALLFSLYPAVQAARLRPSEAARDIG